VCEFRLHCMDKVGEVSIHLPEPCQKAFSTLYLDSIPAGERHLASGRRGACRLCFLLNDFQIGIAWPCFQGIYVMAERVGYSPWPLSLSYHLFSDIHENRMEIRDFCHLTCFNCLSCFVRLGLISALDRPQRHQGRSLRHTPDWLPQIVIRQWH